jgi:hypothetical protein
MPHEQGKGVLRSYFERRAEYFKLRREGVEPSEAWRMLQVSYETGKRYERWWQAIEAGQIEEPVWPWGKQRD